MQETRVALSAWAGLSAITNREFAFRISPVSGYNRAILMSKVAYLGPEGTFSHILARQRFGTKVEHIACSSIEAVFERVASGEVPAGLVPVENSSGGTVYDTVDLLIRNADRIFVREELALDIRIALLGRAGETIRTEMWIDGKDVSFRARVVERDIVVLDNGLATLR